MGQNPVSFASRTECIKAADEQNVRRSPAFTIIARGSVVPVNSFGIHHMIDRTGSSSLCTGSERFIIPPARETPRSV